AAGEYVSVRAQNDLVARELEKERRALADDPEEETEELAQLYVERGMTTTQAKEMAHLVMQNPEVALEVHAREELGVNPNELASPVLAAAWSFAAFAIGALVPLIPWVLSSASAVIWLSVAAGVAGAAAIGATLALVTGHSVFRGILRHVGIAAVAAITIHFVGVGLGSFVQL
ncbi:MAG TPA: VIT1/CCC1 transporter family protein, partial [Acidimicrobiales bacterium]|nr:VIT1/CCC1 transporter family protein [Acidimicrobiales bacterium]